MSSNYLPLPDVIISSRADTKGQGARAPSVESVTDAAAPACISSDMHVQDEMDVLLGYTRVVHV